MAELLPQNFPYPNESAIATYPYTDIKEGTGIVEYVVTRVQVDSTASNDVYPLVTSTINSVQISSAAETVLSASKEFNFDVVFNTPKILNGYIFGILAFRNNGDSATPKVRILKWDGSTETELAAQVTFQTTASSGSNIVPFRMSIDNKKIGSGDSLRIELVVLSGSNAYFEHDPTAAAGAGDTGGRTSFYIPFKLLD